MSLDEMIASTEPEPSSHQQPWATRNKGQSGKKGNRTWTGPHKGSKVFDRDTVRQERAARQAEPSAAVGAVIENKMLPARSAAGAAGGFGVGGGGGGSGAPSTATYSVSSTALPFSNTFTPADFRLAGNEGPALCPALLPMAGMAGFGAGGGGAPGYVPAADPLGSAGSLYTPPGFSSLQQQQQSLLAQLNGFPASSGATPTALGGGVGAPPTALPAPSLAPGAPATKAVFSKADGGVHMSFAPETWPALITPVGVAGAGAAQASPMATGALVGTPVSLPGADTV